MWRWVIIGLCSLSLWCAGCEAVQNKTLTEILNEADLQSCVWAVGNAGPYLSITAVAARGGVPLEKCMDARHP